MSSITASIILYCFLYNKYLRVKTNENIFVRPEANMTVCTSEITVPGFLKRVVDPHATDSSVCCSDTQCTKTFADANVYARELSIYKKNPTSRASFRTHAHHRHGARG